MTQARSKHISRKAIFSEHVLCDASQEAPSPMCIHIAGGNIESVTPMSTKEFASLADKDDIDTLNLSSYLLTPTFTNAHTHLAMSAFRGLQTNAFGGNVVEDLYYQIESKLTAEDVKAFARFAAYEAILAGTGMVWDHYYFGASMAEGLAEAGLPAVIAPTLQDIHGPGVTTWEEQLQTTLELNSHEWQTRGIWSAYGPHATDTVSEALWVKVMQGAESLKLPIHVHVSQSPEEYERLMEKQGCSPIQFLSNIGVTALPITKLLVHGLYASAEDLDQLKNRDVVLGYCPYSQVQFGFPAPADLWANQGLGVALGTDCGASNDSMDVQQELRLAAGGYAFGVTRSEHVEHFYQSASTNGAREIDEFRKAKRELHLQTMDKESLLSAVWDTPGHMHPSVRVGRLGAGYLANIAIWEQNHPALWPVGDVRRTLTMNQTAPALAGLILRGEQRGRIGDFQQSIMQETGFRESYIEAEARRSAFIGSLFP